MIVIVDYGMGNLRSVQKAFEKIGGNVIVSDSFDTIRRAGKIVLPGVGAFEQGINELKKRNLYELIIDSIKDGKPYLGLCLGMQFLFDCSMESKNKTGGFGIIPGVVKKFSSDVKVPHMGWNQVHFAKDCSYFSGIPNGSYFYFVHSYYVVPEDTSVVSSFTDYDGKFASSVFKNNIFATQFHPEKSQKIGLKIIENFSRG